MSVSDRSTHRDAVERRTSLETSLKIGVLELLAASRTTSRKGAIEDYFTTKQKASIMPQAISAWCRQMGHEVYYATYYGRGDPKELLPADLDVVFLGCITRSSSLAYALAKLYKAEGALTVIGGAHAKSYPHDCLRFFDLVVTQCDRDLIVDILTGGCEPGTIISSGRVLTDLPSLEERMSEVRISSFSKGKPYVATLVPMLSSVGCPYTCNFCTDWSAPYALLPVEQLGEDLAFFSREYPGVKMAFHDPNFAVKFDQTLDILERLPTGARNPYVVESSLSVLKGPRLQRLRDTNCFYIAPAIESWSSYSNKAGVGTKQGSDKLELVVDHLRQVHSYVQGIQVNFMFGLDHDEGDEPVELTKEFISRTPFAWPLINIPVPFGGTPLYEDLLREDRILRAMPFSFYYLPYLVFKLKNYDPVSYYERLVEMFEHYMTAAFFARRLRVAKSWSLHVYECIRTMLARQSIREFREIRDLLKTDRQFRAFHEGESDVLPEFYRREHERLLGPYASLISEAERTPELVSHEQPKPVLALAR